MSDGPLKLYWWTDTPNFGDAINPLIVSHVSGRDVAWAEPQDADLFAIGSVMPFVRQAANASERRPLVWGSGCLNAMRRDFVERATFAAVRGPLSAEWLGLSVTRFGDPALLMPDVLGAPVAADGKVRIVPHFKLLDQTRRAARSLGDEVEVVDVRDDALDVVRRIAASRLVLSSSLHGLIVADAFGIPNLWLDPDGNHRSPRFKFYDYACAVGRGLSRPLDLADMAEAVRAKRHVLAYRDGVERARQDLLASFPADLKANIPTKIVKENA